MVRFVMENIHSQHTAECSKQSSRQEEYFLRYSSLVVSSTLFIVLHQEETDQIHYNDNGNYNNTLQIHA